MWRTSDMFRPLCKDILTKHFFVKVTFLSLIWYSVLFTSRFSTRSDRFESDSIYLQHVSSSLPRKGSLNIPRGELLGCDLPPAVGDKRGRGTCRFKNLCTSSYHNAFFVNRGSKVRWKNPTDQTLSEINIHDDVTHTSTVNGMAGYFTYAEVADEYLNTEHHRYVIRSAGKHVLIRHVTSDNIAHDIHDVILPFFDTLSPDELEYGPKYKEVKLNIQGGKEHSSELYNIFFQDFLTDETRALAFSGKGIICFEEILVGLSKETLWYQYGTSGAPQGPLRTMNVTAEHLRIFTNFVRRRFGIDDSSCQVGGRYGVLFVRSRDRRILNRKELLDRIEQEHSLSFIELDLDKNKLSEVIMNISCAKLIMGMHGSMMILAMFLPQNSVLLEMFPYAINPDHYTQYRTMVTIPGMGIEYIAWRNLNRTASIRATDEHLNNLLGSISGMDRESRAGILNRTEVPPKVCCNDAEVRYRLYHETIVDIPEISRLLRKSRALVHNPQSSNVV